MARCRLRDDSRLPRFRGQEYEIVVYFRHMAFPQRLYSIDINECYNLEDVGLLG